MPIKKIKNKIVDVTSDVLSAVPQWKSYKSKQQADRDVAVIKNHRGYPKKGVNQFDENGMVTAYGKSLSAYNEVKSRVTKKKK